MLEPLGKEPLGRFVQVQPRVSDVVHHSSASAGSSSILSGLVFGKVVSLHITGRDRYSRTMAVVMADGVNVNRELVRIGLAWH